jgi:hypothetical protein
MARTDVISTPDQRVLVFLSPTLEELAAERAAARRAISRLHPVPVWYESGARPHPPRRMYRALRQARAWLDNLAGAEFTAFAAGNLACRKWAHPAGRRGTLPFQPAPRVLTGTGGSSERSAGGPWQGEAV